MAVDENDPRYRCCCGVCRAKIGAIGVAIFEGLVALVFLSFAIIFHTQRNEDQRAYISIAAAFIFYTLTLTLLALTVALVLGIFLKKTCLLILHMIKSGIFFGLLIILTILGTMVVVTAGTGALALSAASDGNVDHPHHEAKTTFVGITRAALIATVTLAIYAILQIWFILIVLAAYRAVRDEVNTRGGVVYVPPPQPMTGVVTQTSTAVSGGMHQPGSFQTTTYYPTPAASAPPITSYAPMNSGYPSAPPPYTEKV